MRDFYHSNILDGDLSFEILVYFITIVPAIDDPCAVPYLAACSKPRANERICEHRSAIAELSYMIELEK